MDTIKIYLSGGMGAFGKEHFDESNEWRIKCTKLFRILYNTNDSYTYPKTFNPNDYFNFTQEDDPKYESQREVMEFDLYNLKNSNLLIVNFNDPKSLGTMSEMAIAYDRNIPIYGINLNNIELHPWQKEMCNRVFDSIDKAVNYIWEMYFR